MMHPYFATFYLFLFTAIEIIYASRLSSKDETTVRTKLGIIRGIQQVNSFYILNISKCKLLKSYPVELV